MRSLSSCVRKLFVNIFFLTKHGLNPPFMKEIFCPQTNQYSLRNDRDFNLPRVRSVMYGSEIGVHSYGVHFQFQSDTQLT